METRHGSATIYSIKLTYYRPFESIPARGRISDIKAYGIRSIVSLCRRSPLSQRFQEPFWQPTIFRYTFQRNSPMKLIATRPFVSIFLSLPSSVLSATAGANVSAWETKNGTMWGERNEEKLQRRHLILSVPCLRTRNCLLDRNLIWPELSWLQFDRRVLSVGTTGICHRGLQRAV